MLMEHGDHWLLFAVTLRLRPALIRVARVLPSTPPLFQSLERHFSKRKIGRSLRCGSMLLKRLGMFSWTILKARLYTYVEGNVTIRELMDEQRKRVRSTNPAERLAAALLIPAELSRRLRLLGDSEIAQLLDDEVCARMSILAPEATVCAEAALRLRRATYRLELYLNDERN